MVFTRGLLDHSPLFELKPDILNFSPHIDGRKRVPYETISGVLAGTGKYLAVGEVLGTGAVDPPAALNSQLKIAVGRADMDTVEPVEYPYQPSLLFGNTFPVFDRIHLVQTACPVDEVFIVREG